MRTRPLHSNCYFGLAYLLLRGDVAEVVLAPGLHWPYLPHVGIITRGRHYISFYRCLPHSRNTYAPWWFLGSFEGVRRSRWQQWLLNRGKIRRVEPRLALAVCFAGYCLLFAPWCFAWLCFGPAWSLLWAWHGLRRRIAWRHR